MPGPPKAPHYADLIRIALFEARPAGLSFKQMVNPTGLTPSQVRSGLARLRDTAAEEGWPPLIWTLADGYRFGASTEELDKYEQAAFRTKVVEIGRLITGTLAPHTAIYPKDKWIQLVLGQVKGIHRRCAVVCNSTGYHLPRHGRARARGGPVRSRRTRC
ncbi:RacP protein [Streptomyces sp. KR55]|uniref:RacP protein n=1 Tax=Streptomyces sp. KR55 TaxID=3457425 RepID=UPI003FD17303